MVVPKYQQQTTDLLFLLDLTKHVTNSPSKYLIKLHITECLRQRAAANHLEIQA
jgi:hypothetical protein